MNIYRFGDDLYLIDLPQKIEGFRKFISSWVYTGEFTAVVDPGPKSTIEVLVNSLREIGVRNVDYVLLTHIHIDHAGGVGEFLKYFEGAKLVVSERGKEHLVNPERLWKGSLKVLGDIAKAYGEIVPVDESRFADGVEGVEVIPTPGHAVHHQSYLIGDYLFVGEALGVFHAIKEDIYQRPATPPRFIYEVADESIRKLKKLGNKTACFGHFGVYENSGDVAKYAERQLRMWVDAVTDAICCTSDESFDSIRDRVVRDLLERDARFAGYLKLDRDIRKREDYFIGNTIRGIYEYVKENRI
ncbi:Zn-dependent hydrolase [Geoglobus ahangari]|uniref:Zn-dependent hydrolase n=1 Tax=Geoglobus ahangari TaxID=113653 RepID=A0A0F7IIL7_9EURY|nr:MBL fold metallo-hydrolase [Geoglobus ahangari]AKG91875.1 Zn-dependent hydrolase [Geoglobus ahangari]